MALLGATFLSGCDKIPSFIASGSKMIFYMSTVPVSWTKDTTPNETMCKITNSTLSPGGSLTFSQIFQSSKAISGNTVQQNLGFTANNRSINLTTTAESAGSVPTISPVTVSIAQITTHTHPAILMGTVAPFRLQAGQEPSSVAVVTSQSSVVPLSGSNPHTHTVVPSIPHSHSFGTVSHTHPSISSQHNHSITGSENFDILYIDVIVATKN